VQGEERDIFGNPADLAHYLERLESPERTAWQKPDEVVTALRLAPGSLVCDVGAGPGYFTLRLARAVGATGKVYAIEAEPRMLDVLLDRLERAGIGNVQASLAADGAGLPPEPVDRILMVNAYHHFSAGVAYLRALKGCLRPGGAIVNVDFHGGELPIGPPPDHKVSRERFLEAAAAAGLEVVEERDFLPYQYFLALR
jgi:cyclopropane fatty-acyl-phospholipid synthase-like methyltransferase